MNIEVLVMKTCFYHPSIDAVENCHECGKNLCSQCQRTIDKGHQTKTGSGITQTIHSYHTVCPECHKKFKKKANGIRVFLILTISPYFIRRCLSGQKVLTPENFQMTNREIVHVCKSRA